MDSAPYRMTRSNAKAATSNKSQKSESESKDKKLKSSKITSKKEKKSGTLKRKHNSDEATKSEVPEKKKVDLEKLYPPLPNLMQQRELKDCGTDVADGVDAVDGGDAIDGGPVQFYPTSRKGPVYIIHNYSFGMFNNPFRHGSGNDIGKLDSCFNRLGFHIECCNNLTRTEMVKKCVSWAVRDYRQADCIIVVILTHGETPDKLKGTDGKSVSVDELLKIFESHNPLLVGKPKIFIIQACRGDHPNKGIEDSTTYVPSQGFRQDHANQIFPSSPQDSNPSGYLPRQADRLVVYATGIGHPAYRNQEHGSWYIEELTKALLEEYAGSKNSPRHFADVLTEVQGRVSNYVKHQGTDKLVQMPEFRSSLRGPIYF